MQVFRDLLANMSVATNKEDVLSDFVQSGNIKQSLQELLENEENLELISEKTTVHSNEFLKIVLASRDDWKLRLHIWPVKDEDQYHEPHNHRWDFTSYILTGSITNQIMVEDDTVQTFRKCRSYGTKIGSKRAYQVIKSCNVRKVCEFTYNKDETYSMPWLIIHVAKIPKNNLTATLFVTAPAVSDYSEVYMPDLKMPPSDKLLKSVDTEFLKNKIKSVLENMN